MHRKNLLAAAAAVLVAAGSAAAQAADTVVIGQPNWAYAKVLTNVLKVVIEDNYGLEVEFVPGNHPVFFKAMDQGRGDVDVHPDVWMPNQQPFVDEYVTGRKTVVLTGPKFQAKSGFCTTRKARDDYGLKSIYDLTKPEIVALTDEDGNGKGEIWIGAPGWTSTPIDKVKARDFGFADLYELTESEENVILSKVVADARAGKTVIWACYAPHHIFAMVDVVMLDEPEFDPVKWKPVHPKDDPDWYNKSVVATSWPPIASHMAYSTRLTTAHPEIARLLEKVEFDTALINEWAYDLSVKGGDPHVIAEEWVAANPDRVKSWLAN